MVLGEEIYTKHLENAQHCGCRYDHSCCCCDDCDEDDDDEEDDDDLECSERHPEPEKRRGGE